MPRKLVDILPDFGYTLVSLYEQDGKEYITFVCAEGHTMTEVRQNFNNYRTDYKKGRIQTDRPLSEVLCKKCRDPDYLSNDELISLMEEKFGHFNMVVNNSHHVSYNCGNCGHHVKNNTKANLLKSTGVCENCQHDKQRLSTEEVQQRLVDAGLISLGYVYDTTRPHTDNKHIHMICPNGHPFKQTLYYLTRTDAKQRRCPHVECKGERTVATNQERYGYDNVGQVPEFKEKGVETCLRVYGYRHSAQHPSVQAKKDQSNTTQRKQTVVNGVECSLNAHEAQAVKDIVNCGLARKEDVCVGADSVPTFEYTWNGAVNVYFPDIYLKNLNLIIEVKDWSRFCSSKEEENLSIAKCQAVRVHQPVELWFYSRTSVLQKIWEFHEDGSYSERNVVQPPVSNELFFESLTEKFGFTEFKYSSDYCISYKCKCGERVDNTTLQNLRTSKGFCQKCKASSRKLTLSQIIEKLTGMGIFNEGYQVDEADKESISRINIRLVCPHGHKVKTSLDNLRNGRRCGHTKCKQETKKRNKAKKLASGNVE